MTAGKFIKDEAQDIAITISCNETAKTITMEITSATARIVISFNDPKDIEVLEDALRETRYDLNYLLKTKESLPHGEEMELLFIEDGKEVTNG